MMLHIGRATKMLHLKCMKSRIGRFQPLPLSSQSLVTLKLLHTFFTNKTTKDITTVSILFTAAGSITNISMQLPQLRNQILLIFKNMRVSRDKGVRDDTNLE